MFLSFTLTLSLLGAVPQDPGGPEFLFLDKYRKPFKATPAVEAAFELAASRWQELLADDLVLYVQTSFEPLDSDKGLGGWKPEFLEFPVEDIYAALREDSSSPNDRRASRTMPLPGDVETIPGDAGKGRKVFTLDPWVTSRSGEYQQRRIHSLSLTHAQAKALVLIPHDEEGWDITLIFNSDIRWDMDPSDGIESGYFDLVGTIVHELGHGLGFFSGLDSPMYVLDPQAVFSVLDLFRFNDSSGAMRWDLGHGGNPVLALEDGRAPVGELYPDPDSMFGHWRERGSGASYLGIMSPAEFRSMAASIEMMDQIAIDLIGWEVRSQMDRAPKRDMSLDGQLLRSPKMELRRAEALNAWYRDAPDWALRGIVLTAFGKRWHPIGLESFIDALDSKDTFSNVYAVEGLLATDEEMLPALMSAELIEVLINKSLKHKDDFFVDRVLKLLQRGLPEVEAGKAASWKRWWNQNHESYLPSEWILPPLPLGAEDSDESVAQGFVERAFDLYAAGMDMVIVIDATGSMQGTIDASVKALEDFSAIMEGISPQFRMGLVEYRDHGDMKDGAKLLEQLSAKVDKVHKRLGKVRAYGGGDYPEAVLAGLQVAFDKKMGWKRETNKLLVLVGDAPPHQRTMDDLLTLVREANESPFGKQAGLVLEHAKRGGSNTKSGVRPFVTSAIGVGGAAVEGTTRRLFSQIAEAGGGAYSEVLTAGADVSMASVEIAQHILTLSFGSQWRSQMHDFVQIYMMYRVAGSFD